MKPKSLENPWRFTMNFVRYDDGIKMSFSEPCFDTYADSSEQMNARAREFFNILNGKYDTYIKYTMTFSSTAKDMTDEKYYTASFDLSNIQWTTYNAKVFVNEFLHMYVNNGYDCIVQDCVIDERNKGAGIGISVSP